MAASEDVNKNIENELSNLSLNKIDDTPESKEERRIFALKAGLFLTGVTVVSALAGFGTTVSAIKKREHEVLSAAGFSEAKITEIIAHEEGARLAFRALGWGTLFAVTGVSLLAYTGWKLSGASNFQEFRVAMSGLLPKIPKSQNPGRSEFADFQDFIDYISTPSSNRPPDT